MSARVGGDIGGTFPDIVLRLPEPFERSAPGAGFTRAIRLRDQSRTGSA
jgi:hypothetical protein